jgi:hypothetical protein
MRSLVASLAGSADRPSYTTGPATRRALAEAGALGATTGTVVHLAARPSTDPTSLGVLAHELTHARQPVGRPRFLLGIPSGAADADERTARSVGRRVRDGLLGATNAGATDIGATGIGAAEAAARKVGATEVGAAEQVRFAEGQRFSDQTGAMSAGLVDRLPVGGAAAAGMLGAPSNVVPNEVRSALPGGLPGAVPDGLPSAVSGAVPSGPAALLPMLGSAESTAEPTARTLEHAAGSATHLADQAAGQAAGQATGSPAGHPGEQSAGQAAGQAGHSAADLDRIVEALEQRLLRQLERRGGRYAGVF